MTKDEAIRILDPKTFLEELLKIEYYGGFAGWTKAAQAVYDACILAAEAIREQDERRWIPVTERVPEKSGTYFVVTRTGAVTFARFYPERDIADYSGKFLYHKEGSFQSNRDVIYWMQLPEPPKEME